MSKTKILHYGLHRSGTNFLQALLTHNFYIEIINPTRGGSVESVCHKHARLYDDNDSVSGRFKAHSIKNFKDLSVRIKECNKFPHFFVVLSKDPYSWFLSHKAHAQDYGEYLNIKNHPIKEYNLYYKKLISLSEEGGNFLFVRYVDLISSVDELVRLSELMSLKKKTNEITHNKEKVPHSRHFSEDRRRYYMDKLYLSEYKKEDFKEINDNLEGEVVEYLGYSIIE
jgi:hypothetical protein